MALIRADGAFVTVGETILRPPTGLTPTLTALEHVHAMPKQGVSSTFKFGESFGWWRGWLEAQNLPYILVTPRRWQKAVLDGIPAKGESKDHAWEFVRRRWPDADITGPKGRRLYGRSDAICLAEYARSVADLHEPG
jgi:crossover junction endodeoxyribonuclease RuvC